MMERYHSGEREIQELTGERDRALLNSRAIGGRIPAGARAFLRQQRYCAVGWVSPEGEVWSCFVTGPSGFASPDEAGTALSLDIGRSPTPALDQIRAGDQVGILFVELATRRRLRINGKAVEVSPPHFRIEVAEAFANCPKYIQRREAGNTAEVRHGAASPVYGRGLGEELIPWVTAADTFFVASAQPSGPVDASHRGGNPGFIQLRGSELYIPDYPGNSMFLTLGNFAVYPRAGLTFVDFECNRQLQMTGRVRLDLRAGEVNGETGGTGRWWVFSPEKWIISALGHPLDWTLVDNSPYNP
jgi:uncharacterized protein